MHKTLHIDIDEEITSIIDRVRKAEVREIIVVAPKNALLLQGIVNLKLLKKEADRRKKQIMIITQDKVGKKLIEKAGILVQSKTPNDEYIEDEPGEETYKSKYTKEAAEIRQELQEEESDRDIGSDDFFADSAMEKRPEESQKIAGKMTNKSEIKKVEKKGASAPVPKTKKIPRPRTRMSDIVISQPEFETKEMKDLPVREEIAENEIVAKPPNFFAESPNDANAQPSKMSQISMKKAEKFFRGSRRMKKDIEIARVSGNAKKYFFFFAAVFILLAGLAGAYFLLPKATIALELKNQGKSAALDITANAQAESIDSGSKTIPAKLEQIEQETTGDFDSTGSSSGGAKSSGKVVIYNEFSSESQPLVATTRLETADGKIFRITKNVVVPGVTKVGNETKPGAIEADVVADKAGEDMNIGPSDFRISGFKNNPSKYEKFYAKSTKAMESGGAGEAKVITAGDIDKAKGEITASAKKAALSALKQGLGADRKIFDDSVNVEVLSIATSDNAGTEKEKFSATAKVRASVLSFAQSDVKDMLKNDLARQGANVGAISFDEPINYILSDFDNQQKTLKFSAKADANALSGIDIENFKKGILGKTNEEAQLYAKNFPAIQKTSISFWPFFANRIPMREGRVSVEVK
ncbi:MAG: hypothetical protein WC726_04400 [Parcubacteria group bacterium]|jgi:hypothetical protein